MLDEHGEEKHGRELIPYPFRHDIKPYGVKLKTTFCIGANCSPDLLGVNGNLCLMFCHGGRSGRCTDTWLRLDTNGSQNGRDVLHDSPVRSAVEVEGDFQHC